MNRGRSTLSLALSPSSLILMHASPVRALTDTPIPSRHSAVREYRADRQRDHGLPRRYLTDGFIAGTSAIGRRRARTNADKHPVTNAHHADEGCYRCWNWNYRVLK